jgi:hypothetical protein
MTHDDETRRIHRYVDGDLSETEQAALSARAASDPTVRARIDGLLEVRGLVQEVAEEACRDLDADGLFAGVERAIAAESSGAESSGAESSGAESSGADQSTDELSVPRRPALRVLPGGQDAGTKASDEVRRRRVIGVVIAGLAVAAAAVIALTQLGEPPEVARTEPPAAGEAPAPPEEALAEAAPARTEVLEVDFGTNAGTIFAVEGDEGDRYVVVWLEEDAASAAN